MSGRERFTRLACVAIAAIAGWRAWDGLGTSAALREARNAAFDARYGRALQAAERAERGPHAYEAAWLQGEVLVGTWDWTDESFEEAEKYLDAAEDAYVRAARAAPASPWPWLGLADSYRRRETQRERTEAFDLERLGRTGWERVGEHGRIAVGAARLATELAPHRYEAWDRLIRLYLFFGLDDDARSAAYRAATVQPAIRVYDIMNDPLAGPELFEAFERGSASVLGDLPMMRRAEHLLSLARVAERRDDHEGSLRYLDEAESVTRSDFTRARIRYWKGIALGELGRDDEARAAFETAFEHPHFERDAQVKLADLDRSAGRVEDAMDRYADLRRREPRNVLWVKRYAEASRAAGRLDAAREALLWGKQIAYRDAGLRLQLIEVLRDRGDLVGALRELQELRRLGGADAASLEALEAALSSGSGSR